VPATVPGAMHQQGGPGKTTLGMPRAHALVHRGIKLCIVDAGPPATTPDRAASAADWTPSPLSVVYPRTAGTKGHREVGPSDHMAGELLVDCPAAADSPVLYGNRIMTNRVLIPVTSPGSLYRRWWASERSSVPTREVIPAAFATSVHYHNLMRQMQATCLALGLSITSRPYVRQT